MTRLLLRFSAGALALGALLFGGSAIAACGGGSDGATGPSIKCSDASFSFPGSQQWPQIQFVLGPCPNNSYDASYTGVTYDQFSRVTSYDYTYGCSNGAQRQAGRVSNIQYNNLGQALSWDYSLNGSSCGHVVRSP